MASRIVPGGRDIREHVFESERPPRQRYPSDLTDLTWPRLRHLLVRPHQRRAAMPPRALASTSKQACTSAAPAAPVRVLPTTSSSPGRRPTSTSYAGPATAPGTVPSPSCSTQVRHAHGHNPEPSAGVIDSCSIKASPVRGPRGFDGAKKIDGINATSSWPPWACWWPCWSPRPACRSGRRCPGCSAEPATAAPGSAICGPSRATPAAWCRP
jgi:hypothetical protein